MPIALPTTTPRALLQGHAQQEADIGETCEFESGEPRRAPLYRSVPNVVTLSWSLTQAQFDDWHDWFEGAMQAGHQTFNAVIAEQGSASTVTVEAMFLAPPEYTALPGGRWMVAAQCVAGVPMAVI